MNKNKVTVTQHYNLINARYKLDTSETKFILTILTQIERDDKEFKEYHITKAELEAHLGVELKHSRLKELAKSLMSKPLLIEDDKKNFDVYNWFSNIKYIHGEARFICRIDNGLKPYLLELKSHFKPYDIQNIINMQSEYSIRIYQLLKQNENLTKRTYTVQELQEMMQVPKTFKVYGDFKRKVLEVAKKELTQHSDIYFDYEEIKSGRKVTEITFKIKKNIKNSTPALFKTEIDQELFKYLNKSFMDKKKVFHEKIKQLTPMSDNSVIVKFTCGITPTGKELKEHEIRFENIEDLKKGIY